MSHARILLVSAGIVAIIAGTAFDVVTGREHWPLSPYAMFSEVETERTVTRLRLHGVVRGAAMEEVALTRPEHIAPFDRTRLRIALGRLLRRPDGRSLLRAAVRDVLDRYERDRAAGRHDGPPLAAIRLYEHRWVVRPGAPNVRSPDASRRLLEVRGGGTR